MRGLSRIRANGVLYGTANGTGEHLFKPDGIINTILQSYTGD